MAVKFLRRTAGLFLSLPLAVSAQAPAESERAALAQARQAIESRFAQAAQECATRFFVTACLDEARAIQQAELRPLQESEDALKAAERLAGAQARRDASLRRQREFADAEAQRYSQALMQAAEPANQAASAQASPASAGPTRSLQKVAEQARAEKAEKAQQAANKRRLQAQARAQQVQARQAQAQAREARRLQERGGQPAPAALPKPTAAELAAAARAASAAQKP